MVENSKKILRNLLVTEDDKILQRFYSQALSDLCQNIQIVATPEAALELLQKTSFDFLITDLKLEQGSGLDIIQKVIEFCPGILILVASGHVTDDRYQDDMNIVPNIKGYLQKPFTIDKLHQKIKTIVADFSSDSL